MCSFKMCPMQLKLSPVCSFVLSFFSHFSFLLSSFFLFSYFLLLSFCSNGTGNFSNVFSSCPGQASLKSDLTGTCLTDTCTAQECCDFPTCGNIDFAATEFSSCSAGVNHIKPTLTNVQCLSGTCSANDCCDENPTCLGFATCAVGSHHLKDIPASVVCATATCSTNDCCDENPTCDGFSSCIMGSWKLEYQIVDELIVYDTINGNGEEKGLSQRINESSTICFTGTCENSDCCVSCATNTYSLRPNASSCVLQAKCSTVNTCLAGSFIDQTKSDVFCAKETCDLETTGVPLPDVSSCCTYCASTCPRLHHTRTNLCSGTTTTDTTECTAMYSSYGCTLSNEGTKLDCSNGKLLTSGTVPQFRDLPPTITSIDFSNNDLIEFDATSLGCSLCGENINSLTDVGYLNLAGNKLNKVPTVSLPTIVFCHNTTTTLLIIQQLFFANNCFYFYPSILILF